MSKDAYNAGFNDHEAGKFLSENPYDPVSSEAAEWVKGWCCRDLDNVEEDDYDYDLDEYYDDDYDYVDEDD